MILTKKLRLLPLILLASFAGQPAFSSTTNGTSLFDTVYGCLASSLPGSDTNHLAAEAGQIVIQCQGTTNQAALSARLNTLLNQSGLMTNTDQSEKAAVAISLVMYPDQQATVNLTNLPPFIVSGIPPKNVPAELYTNDAVLAGQPASVTSNLFTNVWANPESSMITIPTNVPSLPYWSFFSSGAEFQNPYQISVSNKSATLTNAGSRTVAVLEFDFINRYVVRDPKRMDSDAPVNNEWGTWVVGKNRFLGGYLENPFGHLPDVQINLGFAFDSGSSSTTYSASTLAGSGDYYSDGAVGLPIWRSQRQAMRQQVSLDFAGGIATDKQFLEVHPNMVFGLGYQTSFKTFYNTSNNACGFFCSRIGAGWTDVPSLTGSGSGVVVDGLDNPEFKFRVAPALEASLAVPLTSAIYLTAQANVFMENRPSSWNITVGATIPFSSIQDLFKSFIGSSP